MTKGLTPLQADILRLAETRNLSTMTYREIARYVDNVHPYSVQLAIERLISLGKLTRNRYTEEIIVANGTPGQRPFLHIPILGNVSCGPATELPLDEPSGYIAVSPSTVRIRKPDATYALMALGDSMNAARINGKKVEEGDYIIVQKSSWGDAHDNDYVISRFNDVNNLKKLRVDKVNRRVVLLSESSDIISHPPIIIDEADMDYYAIEGIAIDVIKGVPEIA